MAIKKEKIAGKHIRHPPPRLLSTLNTQTQILVSTKTPFVSALKRTSKLLENLEHKRPKRSHVSLLGLGKAMDKVLALGLKFKKENYRVDVFTGTEQVVDEFEDPKLNKDAILQKRSVSKVEVKIYVESL